MHSFALLLAPLALALAAAAQADTDPATASNATAAVLDNAQADAIDFSALPASALGPALSAITAAYDAANTTTTGAQRRRQARRERAGKRQGPPLPLDPTTGIIDVHSHVVPDWYRQIVPTTGGNPTPQWDMQTYLSFMAGEGIAKSIFAFSTPGANVYMGNQAATVALARLINEQSAAYAAQYPDKLAFYAVVPLPYTKQAIVEAMYALDTLGAVGVYLYSNFEGTYLGNPAFRSFFSYMNSRKGAQILYVHPGAPYVKVNGQLVEANPTPYPTGNVEFYFETARTFEDLSISQTVLNFTNLHYILPHEGGAFPSIIDRMLKSFPALYAPTLAAYQSRFWYDSAGPTWYHQAAGLLGYGVPTSQLLFGTDYPYAPVFTQAGSLAAIASTTLLTAAQRTALLATNAQALFGKLLPGV